MFKRKAAPKAGAMALAVMMALSCGTPALAAAGQTYTSTDGANVVIFEKYLTMDKEANVPNITFNYTIAAGTAQNANVDNQTVQIYAGNDATRVQGFPSIAQNQAVFAVGQQTYDTVQASPSTLQSQHNDASMNALLDEVSLDSDKKYARKDVKVDFSGVYFKEPGIYRYIITETASASNLLSHGVTDDDDLTRVLDVYVVNDGYNGTKPKLKIEGYVLHNTEATDSVKADGSSQQATKADGFQNDYETENLTIRETVDGNQASRDEYFEVTVKISDAIAGTKYDVTGDFDQTTQVTPINTTQHTNPTSIVVGADGTVTTTYWLQHGQEITINGLAKNTQYDINENPTTLFNEGYTPSATIEGDTKTGAGEANNIAMVPLAAASNKTLVEDTGIQADSKVIYLNTKEGVIPTGVVMAVAPFAMVTLLGGAGAVSVMMKKKKGKEKDPEA